MTPVHLRTILRWLLAVVYVTFGILHLQIAPVLAPMVPHWVPQPLAMIKFTGICEILGGLGLLVAPVRPFAGVMLAIYAVCVYPANLHHAFGHVHIQGMPSSWWYHAPRLAFQPVFVWWALFAGELIDWPLRRRAARRRPA